MAKSGKVDKEMKSNFLDSVVFEATKKAISEVLPSERERQKQKSKQLTQFRAEDDKNEAVADEGEDTPVKKKKSDLPSIDIATIEDKLNTVRAGKSLDDKGVRKQLKLYLQNLNGNEKIALYAFLDAMAKIISAGEDAEEINKPTDEPYGVKMKTKEKPKKTGKPSGEKTPIVVGEAANKNREKKTLLKNI